VPKGYYKSENALYVHIGIPYAYNMKKSVIITSIIQVKYN